MQDNETSLKQSFPPGADVRPQQCRYFVMGKQEEGQNTFNWWMHDIFAFYHLVKYIK